MLCSNGSIPAEVRRHMAHAETTAALPQQSRDTPTAAAADTTAAPEKVRGTRQRRKQEMTLHPGINGDDYIRVAPG